MPSVSTGAERRIMAGRVTPAPLAVMFVDFTAPTRLPPLPSGQGQRLAGGGRSATVAHGSIQGLRLLPCLPPTSDLLLCPPAHPAPQAGPNPLKLGLTLLNPFNARISIASAKAGLAFSAWHNTTHTLPMSLSHLFPPPVPPPPSPWSGFSCLDFVQFGDHVSMRSFDRNPENDCILNNKNSQSFLSSWHVPGPGPESLEASQQAHFERQRLLECGRPARGAAKLEVEPGAKLSSALLATW